VAVSVVVIRFFWGGESKGEHSSDKRWRKPREKKMKRNIPGINGGVCCGNETALVDM